MKNILKKSFIIPYIACYYFAFLFGGADEMPTPDEMKTLLNGGTI